MLKHFYWRCLLRLMAVSVFFAVPVANSFAQISLPAQQMTIEQLSNEVAAQSDYKFFYSDRMSEMKINVPEIKNKGIEELLRTVFIDTGITYKLSEGIVYFSEAKSPVKSDSKQNNLLKGKVTDSKGLPLIGVHVKGKTSAAITDLDGNFILECNPGEELVFSYMGFISKTVKAVGTDMTLVMEEDKEALDEVVVTALGIKRSEKALSYNTQRVDAEQLTKVKDANFVNSLSGKVAGVTINASSSGVGGATKVLMRGTKSIAKGNNALYVVDGIPMFNIVGTEGGGRYDSQGSSEGVADINPEDIESVSILTGASAAALYGSDAANGVVLITTKKGAVGKARVTFSSQSDFSSPFVMPRFQNTYGNDRGAIKSWGDKLDSPSTFRPENFFNTGQTYINSLSLSAGTEKNQTFLSFSSTNSKGIIPNNTYNRYNFSLKNTTKLLNDKLTLDFGANYIIQNDRNMRNQGERFSPIVPLYLFPRGEDFNAVRAFEHYDEGRRISLPYWPYGEGGYMMQNPYWVAYRNISENSKDRYILSGALNYDILDWLKFSTRLRFDNATVRAENKLYAGTLLQLTGNSPKGYYAHSTGIERQLYSDAMFTVSKDFNKFSVNVNFGGIYSDRLNRIQDGFRGPLRPDGISNFFSPYNQSYTGQDASPLVMYDALRTISAFFSGEFGWNRMIYLTVTGRNDWTSALVNTRNKSFFYPSVGLSGVISEMVKLPSFVSYLKLRGSFAQVGNPPTAGLTSPTYTYNEQLGTWAAPTYVPITELFPESTNSWELGLNTKFFEGRISLDATFYKTNTFKQTFNPRITSSSGYSSMYIQTGNIENKGVELVLGYSDVFGGKFGWDSRFSFSANRNRIIELADKYKDPLTGIESSVKELRMGAVGDAEFILRKGGTLGDLYAKSDVLKDENGQILVNTADGSIYPDEKKEYFLGSVFPKCNLGWSNEFSWNGLNLGFLLTARIGGIVVSSTQAVLDNFGVSEQSVYWRERGGIPVNNGIVSAKNWFDVVAAGQGMMAYYTYSATNVRLQEAHISYQLPKKWFKDKMGITLGVTGKNLLMIYNKAPFDPEMTASTGNFYQGIDYFMMPSLRNMGFNVKIQF